MIDSPMWELGTVIEEKNSSEASNLFIHGPYMMADEKNKNGRIYPMTEMAPQVDMYIENMVSKNRAIGELNHPTSAEINPERACHKITELRREGNLFVGKSKILSSPMGQIVRNLLMDDVRLGVSSRALGKLSESTNGNMVSDMHLVCVDVVADPSVDKAFVDGILESKQYICGPDGCFVPTFEKFEGGLSKMPKKGAKEHRKQLIEQFIASLGNK